MDLLPAMHLRPSPRRDELSFLTELLLRRALRKVTRGTIVSTRPSLHHAVARFARPQVSTIGWEHLNFTARFSAPGQRAMLQAAVPRLDGLVVLTQADAEDYRRVFASEEGNPSPTTITVLRNSIAWPIKTTPVSPDSQVVVAMGRLVPRKGFDRLIRAFRLVSAQHPNWQLHIYGQGPEQARLAHLISRFNLESQVRLCGYTDDVPSALQSASIYAMTSRKEGLPMVLIEAMSVGLPLIAYESPRGPAEIISHGRNGLLIPNGYSNWFARGLSALMDNPSLRNRLGMQALRDAEGYRVERISHDWTDFVDSLNHRETLSSSPVGPEVSAGMLGVCSQHFETPSSPSH